MSISFYICFLAYLASVHAKSLTSCDQDTSYKYFSTRTSYHLIGNSTNFDQYIKPGWKQVGLWHLSRHGGRYPETEDIEAMNNFTSRFQKAVLKNNYWLCDQDLNKLRSWKSRISVGDDHSLTMNGRFYMRALGSRMHQRLFDIVSSVRADQVRVQTSNELRTQQSAGEYLAGFLNFLPDSDRPTYSILPPNEDYLLKSADICPKYVEFFQKKSIYCPEQKKFDDDSPLYKQYRRQFASRIGLSMKGKELENAFDFTLKMCQYEYIIDGTDSIWCKYFDKEWLQLVEYREDIKNHCRYGKRHAITVLKECDLVQNALDSLNTFTRDGEDNLHHKIQLLFSHSSTVTPFYTIMGIGTGDRDFNINDIFTENKQRTFRNTFIDPMNSNIALILYKSVTNQTDYTVRVFHNEQLIHPKMCKTADCQLDEVRTYFETFVAVCGSSKQACI